MCGTCEENKERQWDKKFGALPLYEEICREFDEIRRK